MYTECATNDKKIYINVIQGAHFVIFIYCDILNRKVYIVQNINLYVLFI